MFVDNADLVISVEESKREIISAGTIHDTNVEEGQADPTVVVDIGDGLTLGVPKSLTVSVQDGRRSYPALIIIPVRDRQNNLYDLGLLLEGKCSYVPQVVTVDHEMLIKRAEFFETVLQKNRILLQNPKYKNANELLTLLTSNLISEATAEQVKLSASRIGLEIEDIQSNLHGNSLAVSISKFGPSHRKAIADSFFSVALNQSIVNLIANTPGNYFNFNIIMIPIAALQQNVINHPPVNGQWCSLSRRGLPTFLMYSAVAAFAFGTCVYVEAKCDKKMQENGYSNLSRRFATSATSFVMAIGAKLIYKYGPNTNTFYKASTMLKNCGMKLWGCCKKTRGTQQPLIEGSINGRRPSQ